MKMRKRAARFKDSMCEPMKIYAEARRIGRQTGGIPVSAYPLIHRDWCSFVDGFCQGRKDVGRLVPSPIRRKKEAV